MDNNKPNTRRVYVIKLDGGYVLWNLAMTNYTVESDPMRASSWSMSSHAMAARPKRWSQIAHTHREVFEGCGEVVLRHLCAGAR